MMTRPGTAPALQRTIPPTIAVERIQSWGNGDLADLCDATRDAIEAGGGFGWLQPPQPEMLESYWQGLLLVPGRELFVGRVDRVIAGSAQLAHPSKHNEAQSFAAHLTTSFVAPWARGHGLARALALAVEGEAVACGYEILRLDIRETMTAAITLYEGLGYVRWGVDPHYARVDGQFVRGFHYAKALTPAP